jgi:hypothetical protein
MIIYLCKLKGRYILQLKFKTTLFYMFHVKNNNTAFRLLSLKDVSITPFDKVKNN